MQDYELAAPATDAEETGPADGIMVRDYTELTARAASGNRNIRIFSNKLWEVLQKARQDLGVAFDLNSTMAGDKLHEPLCQLINAVDAITSTYHYSALLLARLMRHETDGALATVKANAELVRRARDQAEREEMLDDIRQGVIVIRDTIESVGFWAEESALPIKQISLIDFLKERKVVLERRFANRDLTTEIEKDIGNVAVNPGTVAMLMANSIYNACHHGQANKAKIGVRRRMNSNVEIAVSDNGTGITDEDAADIFGFGVSHGGSSGFGLADADKRMARMNGTIVCKPHGGLPNDRGGQGAKFVMTLAAAQ